MKKQKKTVVEVRIDLFEATCFVLFNCSPAEASQYLQKNLKGLPDHMHEYLDNCKDNPPQGVCLSHTGHSANTVIWIKADPLTSDLGMELLTHEATHSAYRMMKHWSIDIDENSQEVLAMLVSKIVQKVLAIKKK